MPNGSSPDMGAYEYYRKVYGYMHQSVSNKTSSTTLMVSESIVNLDSMAGDITIYLPPLELAWDVPLVRHAIHTIGGV